MLVARTYLGDREDPAVAARLDDADVRRVVLSDTERRRSRVRTETADGADVGIVVGADLGDGAVLETDGGDLLLVELAAVDALVLDLAAADISPLEALELGHALGNRHWDLALRDGEALFPVPDSRDRMRAAVADHLPDGVEPRFEAVPPTTFDDGGDGGHGHSHSHGDGGHGHSHSHGDGGHGHDDDDHDHSDYAHDHSDHAQGVRSVDGGHDG